MEAALLASFLNTYWPKIWREMTNGEEKQKRLEHALDIEGLQQDLRLMAATIQDYESSGMDSGQTTWTDESRRLVQRIEDHIEEILLSGDSSNQTITTTNKLIERLKSIKVVQPTSGSGAPAKTSPSQVDQSVPYLPDHIEHKEEPLKDLLKLVQEDEEPQKKAGKMKVIAIVGFGGLGKTLRAMQVYQSLQVDKPQKFKPLIWVRAEGMSADDILKVIREKLEVKDDGESSSSASQQHITDVQWIKTRLQDKRYD